MNTYGQDPEVRLLSELVGHLDNPTMIDVGAEQGAITEQMLQAGVARLYAFEPHPGNAAALRARFADDPRITVVETALSDADGRGELHVSSAPDGSAVSFGHTLLDRRDTSEISWRETLPVSRRSLESLLAAGEIPARVGILKVDTEGHDLAVVRGMGSLEAEVVMVEHWSDLPKGLGPCPWSAAEMVGALRERSFTHFAFVVHSGEFVFFKWDDATVEQGAMGNLVFFHDDVIARILPTLVAQAGAISQEVVSVGEGYAQAADDRLQLIDELHGVAEERLGLINDLTQLSEDRLAIIDELREQLRAPGPVSRLRRPRRGP